MTIEELAEKTNEVSTRAMEEIGKIALAARKNPLWVVRSVFIATAAATSMEIQSSKREFLKQCELSFDDALRRKGTGSN